MTLLQPQNLASRWHTQYGTQYLFELYCGFSVRLNIAYCVSTLRTPLKSSCDYNVAKKCGNMNQVGSQYYDCKFHSGPFNGVTVFAGEVEDEINKPGDGDVMLQVKLHALFCSENDCVLTEEEMTSTDKVIRNFV